MPPNRQKTHCPSSYDTRPQCARMIPGVIVTPGDRVLHHVPRHECHGRPSHKPECHGRPSAPDTLYGPSACTTPAALNGGSEFRLLAADMFRGTSDAYARHISPGDAKARQLRTHCTGPQLARRPLRLTPEVNSGYLRSSAGPLESGPGPPSVERRSYAANKGPPKR